MRSLRRRWILGAAAALSFGALYQTACMSFAGNEVIRSIDFCFLFDCQNGALGGLIDPCPNVVTNDTGNSQVITGLGSAFIFTDCPVEIDG